VARGPGAASGRSVYPPTTLPFRPVKEIGADSRPDDVPARTRGAGRGNRLRFTRSEGCQLAAFHARCLYCASRFHAIRHHTVTRNVTVFFGVPRRLVAESLSAYRDSYPDTTPSVTAYSPARYHRRHRHWLQTHDPCAA